MSRTNGAWIAILLPFFVTGNASAPDAKLALALTNVQSEMSDCLAYLANIRACVGTQDKGLSEGTQKTLDALTSMAVKVWAISRDDARRYDVSISHVPERATRTHKRQLREHVLVVHAPCCSLQEGSRKR